MSLRRGVIATALGKQPVGTGFVTPYVVFIAAVFAYPLGFAVYMSFHDYFFAAPGAIVDRPFVGFQNYVTVLSDPAVRRSFANVGIFLLINVPLTVVLSLLLANALNAAIRWRAFFRVSYYVPYVTASVAVVGVWLFLFNSDGLVNSVLGPLAPDPSWLVNSHLAMPTVAVYVTSTRRPRWTGPVGGSRSVTSPCRGCGRPPPWWYCWPR
jgi:multiple sugar transport system permease protein